MMEDVKHKNIDLLLDELDFVFGAEWQGTDILITLSDVLQMWQSTKLISIMGEHGFFAKSIFIESDEELLNAFGGAGDLTMRFKEGVTK